MNKNNSTLIVILLIASTIAIACAPATAAPSATQTQVATVRPTRTAAPIATETPVPTATAAPWTPVGKIVQPTDLNGKTVRLVSFKSEAGCCEEWVQVEVEGDLVWTKVLFISYHPVVRKNDVTYFDQAIGPWLIFEYAEGKFDDETVGVWQTNKYVGDDVVEVWDASAYSYPTNQDQRILAYWSDFQPLADGHPYVVDGLLDTSAGHVATVMLDYWWLMPSEWEWEAYQEIYQLVNGYLPNPMSASTYAGFYGMAVDRVSDDKVVVTFSDVPPDATILGCLPQETITAATRWDEKGLELLIDDFYVAHSGYISYEGVEAHFTPYDRYVAVVNEFPVWPKQDWLFREAPDGVTMPELQIWELCGLNN